MVGAVLVAELCDADGELRQVGQDPLGDLNTGLGRSERVGMQRECLLGRLDQGRYIRVLVVCFL